MIKYSVILFTLIYLTGCQSVGLLSSEDEAAYYAVAQKKLSSNFPKYFSGKTTALYYKSREKGSVIVNVKLNKLIESTKNLPILKHQILHVKITEDFEVFSTNESIWNSANEGAQ